MRFDNPTSLRLGMNGTIVGLNYRVVGRVVMGMEEAGRTYYWNEFNLADDRGGFATLVFEETDSGAEWRMFTLFEPQNPMSVQEAATKRVGNNVNFDGTSLRVTLIDESRVYFIEGQAPEGVEVGDIARYFNAEGGNKMQVASWTGDEIEFFRGINLPRGAVKNAFGLGTDPSQNFQLGSREINFSSTSWAPKFVGTAIVAIVLFVGYSFWKPQRAKSGPIKPKLAASPLILGKYGKLFEKYYKIENHAVVEVAQVNQLFDRHEYELSHDDGKSVLISGFKPENKWLLFTPFEPEKPMNAFQAAAMRVGDKIEVDGHPIRVTELFQTTVQQVEGDGPIQGIVSYGFIGEGATDVLVARWNHDGIKFYRGMPCAEKTVKIAFR